MQLRHDVLERPGLVALAQPEGRAERIAGAAVVARDLVGGPEPLVDLGRLGGQLVLEGERQPAADDLDALLVGAALDPGHAVQAQRAGAEVGAVGAHGLGRRELGGRRRLAVPAGALQVARPSTRRSAAASPGRPLAA